MKTKEELNSLKNEVDALNKKLAELTDRELEEVTGGMAEEYYNSLSEYNSGKPGSGRRQAGIAEPGERRLPGDNSGEVFPDNDSGFTPYVEFGDDWN